MAANRLPSKLDRRGDRNPGSGTQIELDDRAGWYRCSRCIIEYYFGPGTPKCPLCAQEIKYRQMEESLKNATGQLEILERQVRMQAAQSSIIEAMRQAVVLLNGEDRAFLKAALYQFRTDKSVSLKVVHDSDQQAIGLLADWRRGEPEAREFTSVGGRAIAGYLEEAQNAAGSAKAMDMLMHALQSLLPGGQQ